MISGYYYSFTPLCQSIFNSRHEIFLYLLDLGADPSIGDPPSNFVDAMDLAKKRNMPEMIKVLEEDREKKKKQMEQQQQKMGKNFLKKKLKLL